MCRKIKLKFYFLQSGVAIDWSTHVVYWTDATYNTIFAASLDSIGKPEAIVDTGQDEPYAIVVYPRKE